MKKDFENEKALAAKEAVKLIRENQIIGLGTGSTAYYAIKEVGELVKKGLQIKAVSTSDTTTKLAEALNIPVVDINTVDSIDVTIDGADEFTTDLALIKGGGGALLKEKIVARLSKLEIIIVDSSKKVELLGKFKVPIEIIPFAANYVLAQIRQLKGKGQIRIINDTPFVTDQGNYIVDADFGLIANPPEFSRELNEMEGAVAHGLFINLATKVIMGHDDATTIFAGK